MRRQKRVHNQWLPWSTGFRVHVGVTGTGEDRLGSPGDAAQGKRTGAGANEAVRG